MEVERNGFGRQVASFETYLDFLGIDRQVEAVFIRAPYIESVGPNVKVLATIRRKNCSCRTRERISDGSPS